MLVIFVKKITLITKMNDEVGSFTRTEKSAKWSHNARIKWSIKLSKHFFSQKSPSHAETMDDSGSNNLTI